MKIFCCINRITSVMEGIIDLHHWILCYLILISIFVLGIFLHILLKFFYQIQYPQNIHDFNVRKLILPLRKLSHSTSLEIFWTILPSLILVSIAAPSFELLYSLESSIDPKLTVKITGHQWYWSYEYKNIYNSHIEECIKFNSYLLPEENLPFGRYRLLEVDNELSLPAHTPIRLLITSSDVIHSWTIPSLGVKVDGVPGRLNQAQILSKSTGYFFGQCSELCGVNHGFMPIKCLFFDPGEYLFLNLI
jgi:cytochrome c oxidase subunit 2